jgi:hypothetical protein
MACRSIQGTRFSPPSTLGRPVPPPKQPTLSVRSLTPVFYRRNGAAERYNSRVAAIALDPAVQRAYLRCAADLRRVFADRFVGLLAGGPAAAVAFASAVRPGDLEALGSLADTWHREGIATPIVMTPDEFRRSLDAFPLEYQALIEHHVIVDGVSPIEGASVRPDDLRRACEAQARGHLIHLRQGWIDAGSDHHGHADLLVRSAAPLRQILTNLARLQGERPAGDADLAAFGSRVAGLPDALVTAVLELDRAPHRADTLVPRLPEYLDACVRLWAFIDDWRAA